jgi:hypothetical protein
MEDKTNDEIIMIMKNLEMEFINQKQILINEYDKLVFIENKYKEATQVINNRLKGK